MPYLYFHTTLSGSGNSLIALISTGVKSSPANSSIINIYTYTYIIMNFENDIEEMDEMLESLNDTDIYSQIINNEGSSDSNDFNIIEEE